MKIIIIVAGFCFLTIHGNAQTKQLDSLKNLLTNTSKPVERFNILRNILELNLSYKGDNVDSAFCIELLQIAQQQKNDSLLAISYNWVGAYFAFTTGDNRSALENFFKAIPLAEKAKDKRRISSLYFDIALTYISLENFEESYKNTIKGGEYLPDKSSPMYNFMLIQYQRNLAFYYLSTKHLDSALKYIQAADQTNQQINSTLYRYTGLRANAAVYVLAGDNEMAELYFKRTAALTDSIKMGSAKFIFYDSYIPFLLGGKKITEAKEKTIQLIKLGDESGNNLVKRAAAGYMRQIYDTLHIADSAYYYSRKESVLKDSIFSQDNINKIQALAFNEQLRNMEEDAKQAEAKHQRKQNIQFAVIAFGIITFIVLFLLFSRSIVANEKWISFFGILGLLIVFEFINLLIHPWLSSFTHDSPVLMLLALVTIASLLIPLHHRLEKWIKDKIVEKNKAIRLAAAKKTVEQLEGDKIKIN